MTADILQIVDVPGDDAAFGLGQGRVEIESGYARER
jgi:hypothetical protein